MSVDCIQGLPDCPNCDNQLIHKTWSVQTNDVADTREPPTLSERCGHCGTFLHYSCKHMAWHCYSCGRNWHTDRTIFHCNKCGLDWDTSTLCVLLDPTDVIGQLDEYYTEEEKCLAEAAKYDRLAYDLMHEGKEE